MRAPRTAGLDDLNFEGDIEPGIYPTPFQVASRRDALPPSLNPHLALAGPGLISTTLSYSSMGLATASCKEIN